MGLSFGLITFFSRGRSIHKRNATDECLRNSGNQTSARGSRRDTLKGAQAILRQHWALAFTDHNGRRCRFDRDGVLKLAYTWPGDPPAYEHFVRFQSFTRTLRDVRDAPRGTHADQASDPEFNYAEIPQMALDESAM